MRIDSNVFRGRPLGHNYDPLRSRLDPMPPETFNALMESLLQAHGFRQKKLIDASGLLGRVDMGRLIQGVICNRFEIVISLTTEFTPNQADPTDPFRIEGEPITVQGDVAVLIHSRYETTPNEERLMELGRLLSDMGLKRLLVFVNEEGDSGYRGAFRYAMERNGIMCFTQHLQDLAYNVLTTTTVYLAFRGRISFNSPRKGIRVLERRIPGVEVMQTPRDPN